MMKIGVTHIVVSVILLDIYCASIFTCLVHLVLFRPTGTRREWQLYILFSNWPIFAWSVNISCNNY